MKEQNKIPERELNEREITNQSDTEFKTLVIRMLKELNEYSNNIKEDMKVTLNEIKKNLQGAISGGEEARIQINSLDQNKEINIQLQQSEERRIQKNEERLRNLQDNLKHSNIRIIGVPEGEEEEQEIGNLFEKIMKENFPNLVKEIYMQAQEAQRVPNQMDGNRPIPRHIIIKMPNVTGRES